MTTFKQFKTYMHEICGMEVTEDGAVHCCECGEPIYEEDFLDYDWDSCPICGWELEWS